MQNFLQLIQHSLLVYQLISYLILINNKIMGNCLGCDEYTAQAQVANQHGLPRDDLKGRNSRLVFPEIIPISPSQRMKDQNGSNKSSKSIKNQNQTDKTTTVTASIRFQSLIDLKDIEQKLKETQNILTKDPEQAIKNYLVISESIMSSSDRGYILMEKYAYAQAQLTNLYIQTNNPIYTLHLKNALKLYSLLQADYYEEIITLLNNAAVKKEKEKEYNEAIQTYIQIMRIQDKYISSNDSRKLLTQNNLACAYCESGQREQGVKMLNKLILQIKQQKVDREIAKLIEKNLEYYSRS